jgi:ubiquinone/menaquinone biosynthesis C-methylase UbiE
MLKKRKIISPVSAPQFLLGGLTRDMNVLDIGFGNGKLMVDISSLGCSVMGVEVDAELVRSCQAKGFKVSEGAAEKLPISDASIDAIVCSVVLPYTDERRAVAEWARVLKSGGMVNATYHGTGYGLHCLFHGGNVKRRIYGLRMLMNALFYGLTSRRLPGFLGDTLCQTSWRMRSYYRAYGLQLKEEYVEEYVMGFPRFLFHRLVKIQ